MLLRDLTVRMGGVISRNNTSCFYELLFFGVLPNRHRGKSAPVLLTGSAGFGQPEDWLALEREELECLLPPGGFKE